MDINWNAPIHTQKEIVIQSSIENVWNVLIDINKWSEWNSDITSAKLEGELKAGSVFRWKSGGMNIKSTLHVVTTYKQIGWVGKAFGTKAVHLWTLESQSNQTFVRTKESMEGLLPQLFGEPMQKKLNESLERWLNNLKKRSEK
jgi:hypothetical protein